jgi:hypothetical protein
MRTFIFSNVGAECEFQLEVVRLPDTPAQLAGEAAWEGCILWQQQVGGGSFSAHRSDAELLGWLVASLLFTRRLGGRRRRGWGRCRFTLKKDGPNTSKQVQSLHDWMQGLRQAGKLT